MHEAHTSVYSAKADEVVRAAQQAAEEAEQAKQTAEDADEMAKKLEQDAQAAAAKVAEAKLEAEFMRVGEFLILCATSLYPSKPVCESCVVFYL